MSDGRIFFPEGILGHPDGKRAMPNYRLKSRVATSRREGKLKQVGGRRRRQLVDGSVADHGTGKGGGVIGWPLGSSLGPEDGPGLENHAVGGDLAEVEVRGEVREGDLKGGGRDSVQ